MTQADGNCQYMRECYTGIGFSRFSIAAIQQPKVCHQREQTVIQKKNSNCQKILLQGFLGFQSKTQMTNLVSHPET